MGNRLPCATAGGGAIGMIMRHCLKPRIATGIRAMREPDLPEDEIGAPALVLAQHPFLKGVGRRHLDLLAGCASTIRFEADKFLFREGEDANHFYFICSGRVAIEIFSPQSGPIEVEVLARGDVLGWSWLVPPYCWRFDARAVEVTHAIVLDGKWLRDQCDTDKDLGYELLKRFVSIVDRRLQATRLQLLDLHRD